MSGPEKFDDEFGKEWREAFDDFSQTPPPAVWENIDRELTYRKMIYYKKSARLFQYLSAAILLLVGFLSIYIIFLNSNNQLLQNNRLIDISHPKPLTESIFKLDTLGNYFFKKQGGFFVSDNSENSTSNSFKSKAQIDEKSKIDNGNSVSGLVVPPIYTKANSALVKLELLEDLSPLPPNANITIAANFENHEIWRVADYSYLMKKSKSKTNSEKRVMWAGIDLGSGSFDPNYQSSAVTTINNSISPNSLQFSGARTDAIESQSPQIEESMSAGSTVSLGLNFGFHLSEKWSLSSGIRYNLSQATNNTNVVVQSTKVQEAIPASQEFKNINQVNNAVSSNSVVKYDFQDVELSNEFQFASLPISAGYLIYNKKFSVELNAGVAANFYLGNKLTDSSNEFADVSIGPGGQSAYKEVSFSGLAGIELGYLFLDRFEVIVQPNYQQSLNALTKESAEFEASPSGFGVSTGLRYRFK
ncbi:MAG: hypothetical protein RIA69_03275 [Cyclobacteriaceae bacterium]